MNRRAFLSWGTLGVGALTSAVAVSMAAVGRFLVPNVFYEPPQSFKIGNPADETTDAILRGRPARVSFASPIMMRSVVPPDES